MPSELNYKCYEMLEHIRKRLRSRTIHLIRDALSDGHSGNPSRLCAGNQLALCVWEV
jgi:hypothetical protein